MKNIGIWMDRKVAYVISDDQHGNQKMEVIESTVDDNRLHDDFGTSQKGGPNEIHQDKKILEREKQQLKAYFTEVASQVNKAENIVVFGPAKTGQQFIKNLQDSKVVLAQKSLELVKEDSMTENQMKAFVREYFDHKKG